MAKLNNLIGQKFGLLTVVDQDEPTFEECGTLRTRWVCQCTCGQVCSIKSRYLTRGTATSCGEAACKNKHKGILHNKKQSESNYETVVNVNGFKNRQRKQQ